MNASYTNFMEDHNILFAGTGMYLGGITLGVGWLHTRQEDIQGANEYGEFTKNFNYVGNAAFVGFGKEVGNIRFGITAKGIQEELMTTKYQGGGMDAGVQADVLGSFIRVGVVMHDIVSLVSSPVETRRAEIVDRTLGVALTINPPTANNIYFLLGTQRNLSAEEDSSYGVGIRYELDYFSINAGFSNKGASGGFGFMLPHFDLDLAASQDNLEPQLIYTVEMNAAF